MRYLGIAEVLAIHDYQIQRFGGTHGVLNLALLESSISRPETNISGVDMYPSPFEKAAVLAYSVIKNHPFLDANKRTGLHVALTFLELNNIKIDVKPKSLVKLGLDIANGKMSLEEVAEFFTKYVILS